MTDLREALQTLAREREPLADRAVPPEELWGRGVRRRRVRTGATALVAVLVLAVGVGLGSWLPGVLRPDAVPAAPHGAPRIPRSIAAPGGSVPGTAQAGPLGRLAVVWSTDRREGTPALFGISASTGRYRFLDLPRLASPEQFALSPDGRRLAYWQTGPVPGRPVPGDPTGLAWKTVVGVAVYDTVTGRSVQHRVASPHGLAPQGLWWADDDQLVLSYGFYVNRHASHDIRSFRWSGGSRSPVQLRGDPVPFVATTPDAHGGVVLPGAGSTWRQYDDLAAIVSRTGRTLTLPRGSYGQVTVDGRRVVAIRTGPRSGVTDSSYSWLETGTVGADGRVTDLRRVGRTRASQLIGWRDDGRLLVVGFTARSRTLLELDPATATVRRLGTITAGRSFYSQPAFATEVAALGTADRPLPPGPDDSSAVGPGVGVGVGVGAALVVLLGVGLMVRRRRARG